MLHSLGDCLRYGDQAKPGTPMAKQVGGTGACLVSTLSTTAQPCSFRCSAAARTCFSRCSSSEESGETKAGADAFISAPLLHNGHPCIINLLTVLRKQGKPSVERNSERLCNTSACGSPTTCELLAGVILPTRKLLTHEVSAGALSNEQTRGCSSAGQKHQAGSCIERDQVHRSSSGWPYLHF